MIVYIHYILFIHSSIDGLLGCLPIFAIINNAAVNIEVHISFWNNVLFSLVNTPSPNEITGSYGTSILIFWGNFIMFSIVAALIYSSMNSAWGFPFLHIVANFCCCLLVIAILTDVRVWFWCAFTWWLVILSIF